MIFLEPFITWNGNNYTKTHLLSYKEPLYSSSKRILGILGISIVSSIYELQRKTNANVNQWIDHFKITQREYDCLYHLIYGRSAKQIAINLDISSRTVEEYLTSARIKLNCANRSQLIETVINLGII